MRSAIRLGFLAAICTLVAPATAGADTSGANGRIVKLSINESTSDDFAKFHGSITVKSGKNASEVYKWGGNHCPGVDVSAANVERLALAFHTRRFTVIKPRYKPGAGGNKCLVGFDLRGKANEGPS
jgi:hypothetical protein